MYGYYYPGMPQPQYPVMPQQGEMPVDYYPYYDNEMRKEDNSKKAIIQPKQVNQQPAHYTALQTVDKIPEPNRYVTNVYPVYLKHLSENQGNEIKVQTCVNEVSGTLVEIAIDHIALKPDKNKDKTLHIPLGQIVYFESD